MTFSRSYKEPFCKIQRDTCGSGWSLSMRWRWNTVGFSAQHQPFWSITFKCQVNSCYRNPMTSMKPVWTRLAKCAPNCVENKLHVKESCKSVRLWACRLLQHLWKGQTAFLMHEHVLVSNFLQGICWILLKLIYITASNLMLVCAWCRKIRVLYNALQL